MENPIVTTEHLCVLSKGEILPRGNIQIRGVAPVKFEKTATKIKAEIQKALSSVSNANINITASHRVGDKPAALPNMPLVVGPKDLQKHEYGPKKIIVMMFWSSWCHNSHLPMQELHEIVAKRSDWKNVEAYGVSLDKQVELQWATIEKKGWNALKHLNC